MKMQFTFPKMRNPFKFLYRKNKEPLEEIKIIEAKIDESKNIKPKFIQQKNIEEKIIKIERNYMEDGCDIKWEDTQEFTFPIKGGRVIKVYDADTITIASKLPYVTSPLYRFSVRLNGIDTPEIKGKTEEEKVAAKKVQKILEDMILKKTVNLKNVSTEKYGRILADVYLGNLHLNEWLILNGHAVKYDGGKKQIFSEMNLNGI